MKTILCSALAVLLTTGSVAAGEIYKCKQGDTTVFSPTPCGKSAEKVDTSRALRTGSGGESALRDISLSVADQNCRNAAYADTIGASTGRIGGLTREKDDLTARTRRAKNNLAGATYEAGLRQQIAGIEASIQQERNAAQSAYRDALKACDEQKKSAQAGP